MTATQRDQPQAAQNLQFAYRSPAPGGDEARCVGIVDSGSGQRGLEDGMDSRSRRPRSASRGVRAEDGGGWGARA